MHEKISVKSPYKQKAGLVAMERKCLKCQNPFTSESAGNRLCPGCAKKNRGLSRINNPPSQPARKSKHGIGEY